MTPRALAFREDMYFDQLTEFADAHGWHGETPGGEPLPMTEPENVERWSFVWSTPEDARVEYVYDEIVGCDIFRIDGERIAEVEADVRATFDVQDVVEAATEYSDDLSPDERTRLLDAISLMLPPEENEEVAEAITAGLHDRVPSVRFAALCAAHAARWPRFRPRVRELSEIDPDPNVRAIVGDWLQDWAEP